MSSLAGTGALLSPLVAMDAARGFGPTDNELLTISRKLLRSWCTGLVDLQLRNTGYKTLDGGILCPACSRVHGRIGDAIYPLLFLADETGEQRWLTAALGIYEWMERNVSHPDGAWSNDVNVSEWKGITVFGSISLAEALLEHGHLLDDATRERWTNRLRQAADYVATRFPITAGNINYPVTAAHAFFLYGKLLDAPAYFAKAREYARFALGFFTEQDSFLFGEGRPRDARSPTGCRPIDLGYNVEESLPALVRYAQLAGDEEVLAVVTKSLRTHADFLLPDGAWDNSWGTRNYKWSWWGSRTSDGCSPAYALLSAQEPDFYPVALANTRLLETCTEDNLLYGGLHYRQQGLPACVHHAFCHAKAMATVLAHHHQVVESRQRPPRAEAYGVKVFRDIRTWLVSRGGWRGTITGYDMPYRTHSGGHVSGGALSILWHERVGPILTASMNRYQLWEAQNMQMQRDKVQMPLTPRFEVNHGDQWYSNICDYGAQIAYEEKADGTIVFSCIADLVTEERAPLPVAPVRCWLTYIFHRDYVVIQGHHDAADTTLPVRFVLPVVATVDEPWRNDGAQAINIQKDGATLRIEADTPIEALTTAGDRVFNYVPGVQALPLQIDTQAFTVKITVHG